MQRSVSFRKSLFFHLIVLFCQGAGLKRGQQPVTNCFFAMEKSPRIFSAVEPQFNSNGRNSPFGFIILLARRLAFGCEIGCWMGAYAGGLIEG